MAYDPLQTPLVQRYGLNPSPWNKNLDYTEEQLGFKRKYKGREVLYNGQPWLIIQANRHRVLINDGTQSNSFSYPDFHRQCKFLS